MRIIYVLVGWLAFIAVCQSLTGCVEAKTPEQKKAIEAARDKTHDMKCIEDVTSDTEGIHLHRCENEEAVCYMNYQTAAVCHWKPVSK